MHEFLEMRSDADLRRTLGRYFLDLALARE